MNIADIFSGIRQTRNGFIALINEMSVEQLNQIPPGFRNNIAWNFGHLVVTTPSLCYQRTGIQPEYPIPLQSAYKKDTWPTNQVQSTEIYFLRELMQHTIDQIEHDYHAGVFNEGITPFATATYGATLNTIEEVLLTTLMHDNVHWGYAQAQRRIILQK
jgi:hypothetical protein